MFLIYEHDVFLLFLFLLRITGLAGSSALSGLDYCFSIEDDSSSLSVCSSKALTCSIMFPMLSVDKLPPDSTNSLNSWHLSFLLVRTLRTLPGFILESFNILKKLLSRITKWKFENKLQFFIRNFCSKYTFK